MSKILNAFFKLKSNKFCIILQNIFYKKFKNKNFIKKIGVEHR